MEINVSKSNTVGVIHMAGRFDFNMHRSFKESYNQLLQDASISTIEVNLSRVEYMDSSALGMLLMLRDRASAARKEVRLSQPNATVMQILDIANFSKLFHIN